MLSTTSSKKQIPSSKILTLVIPLVIASALSPLSAEPVPCPLDPLLSIPDNWQMTPDAFEKTYTESGKKLYVWLTADRTRAKISRKLYGNVEIDLTAFEGSVPAQEAIIDFAEGRLNLVTISIFNRADSPDITPDDFKDRFTNTGKAVGKALGAGPRRRDADSKSGLLTEGFSWYSQNWYRSA